LFHAVIDACFKLRARLDGRVDAIAAITVHGSALLLARGDRVVRNERDARVSIHHCAACALSLGSAGVPEFSEGAVIRPDIVNLRQKVTAALDASLPDGAARVDVQLRSGERLEETVMVARGSLADPLSDADIEAKLRACLRLGDQTGTGRASSTRFWRLDTLAELSSLMSAPRSHRSAEVTAL